MLAVSNLRCPEVGCCLRLRVEAAADGLQLLGHAGELRLERLLQLRDGLQRAAQPFVLQQQILRLHKAADSRQIVPRTLERAASARAGVAKSQQHVLIEPRDGERGVEVRDVHYKDWSGSHEFSLMGNAKSISNP